MNTEQEKIVENYYKYWGKTDDNNDYHLLVYHCFDVAAIGWYLLNTLKIKKLTQLNHFSQETIIDFFLLFLSLHDLGKFADAFQNLKKNILFKLQSRTSKLVYNRKDGRHDQLGWDFYIEMLEERILAGLKIENTGPVAEILRIFAGICFGHHGIPAKQGNSSRIKSDFTESNHETAIEYADVCLNFFITEKTKKQVQEFSRLNKKERRKERNILK